MRKAGESMDQVMELVHEERILTIFEVADIFGISFGSRQKLLKDSLNMCQIAAKFLAWLLREEQK
jgi:hypothetical protein